MLKGSGVISLVGGGGKTSLMFSLAHELEKAGETVLTTTTTKIFLPELNKSRHIIISSSIDEIAIKSAIHLKKMRKHITIASGWAEQKTKLSGFTPEAIDAIKETGLFQWIIVEADGSKGRSIKAPASHEPVIPESSESVIGIAGLDVIGKPLDDRWVFRSELFSKITGLSKGFPVLKESIARAFFHNRGIMKGAPAAAKRIAFLNKADISKKTISGKTVAKYMAKHEESGLDRVIVGSALFEPFIFASYDLR